MKKENIILAIVTCICTLGIVILIAIGFQIFKNKTTTTSIETQQRVEEQEYEEIDPGKINIPNEYNYEISYTVKRRDIDINGHMHNLYYLDLAYEALPEEIYNERPFDSVRIQYRKEIKLGDTVKCKYAKVDDKNIVAIYSEDENTLHALVELS